MLGLGSVVLEADGRRTRPVPNQRQNGYAQVCVKLFGYGDRRYKLSAVYIEYENTASPGDPVTPPSFDKSEGVEYYSALSGSSDRDYLRLPVSGVAARLADGFEGADENVIDFTAITEGTVGVHGKPFSAAANSTIFGVALVAAPDWDDPSADLVFGRAYYETADQLVKPAGGQVTVVYTEEFPEDA